MNYFIIYNLSGQKNVNMSRRKQIFRIMRISSFLLFFCCMVICAADTYSQKAKVNMKHRNVHLITVLDDIESQTDYLFLYNGNQIDVTQNVSVNVKNMPVSQVLSELFTNSQVHFAMEGTHIVLMSDMNEMHSENVSQQQITITGKVTDAYGEPLPGVSVKVKGTTQGTATDANGAYSLSVPDSNAALIFSYIGYSTQEKITENQRVINIVLLEDTQQIEEVVVVGYGMVQRKNFTGSVSNVNVANSPVALSPRTNAMDILRGTVTGAIVSREGDAGSSPSIEVHGQKSVNSPNTNPLIVLDGVIYLGGWRDIDPSIIESMSVLKDATSLAAYGSQAANGVVMITTKKGKLGKPVISLDVSFGPAYKAMITRMDNPEGYVEYRNLQKNSTPQGWMRDRNYRQYEAGNATDWWDFSTQTGMMQNYSLSVSGATEKFNYYIAAIHTGQKGVVIGDEYKRETFLARLQNDITDWLQVGTQVNYSYNNYDGARAGGSRINNPYAQPYRVDNDYNVVPGKLVERFLNDPGEANHNPLMSTSKYGGIDDYERYGNVLLKGHVLLKVPWIKGLSYRLNASWSQQVYNHNYFSHELNQVDGESGEGRFTPEGLAVTLPKTNGYNQVNQTTSYVLDNILNYTRQWNKHFVDATLVYTRDLNKVEERRLTGTDFSGIGNTLLGYDGLAFAATRNFSISKTQKGNIGYLGRLVYVYNDRYHLTASIRRDGSTVFGADQKWGTYPALGAAWTVSRESFMQQVDLVSYLKLKLSWGKNGNQSLNPYGTLTNIRMGREGNHPTYLGEQLNWGQYISSLGNPELGWETTTSLNGGFEIGLLDDRIRFEMDTYKSQTTDQIFSRTVPPMGSGFTSVRATMGQVDNFGIEATLNTVNMRKKGFEWSSMLNFYLNRNKLVELYGDGKDDLSSSLFLGKSLGAIYRYKLDGIVQESDTEYMAANNVRAGDPKFANVDGSADGRITADDRTIVGYTKENFRMNMSHTLTYKNWELYALFSGIFSGGDYGKDTNSDAYNAAIAAGIVKDKETWWTPENKSNIYPRINFSRSGDFAPVMSYGWVRMQDLSLSYTFRQPAIMSTGIQNLRVYVSVKNLFTLTNWIGGDPETRQRLGNSLGGLSPLQRTYLFGLNLSF